MREVQMIRGATGPTGWCMVNYMQSNFNIGYRCTIGGATSPSLTFSLEGADWSGNYDTIIRLTRSTTTATLVFNAAEDWSGNTWVNHGLAVGDSLLIGGPDAPFAGTYAVASVVDSRTVTFTVANSGALVAGPGTYVARLFVIQGLNGVTGTSGATSGSITTPINFIRSNVTAFTSGALTLSFNQGVGS